MQALKAMVILMGVLIVGALAVLSYGLMNDWHKKENPVVESIPEIMKVAPQAQSAEKSGSQSGVAISRQSIESFEDWNISLPNGGEVIEMSPQGSMLLPKIKVACSFLT